MNYVMKEVYLLLHAFQFAARKHRGQRRKGGQASPYINHLIDVAEKLWEIGRIRDITVITAGILHDTIEDTETTEEELEAEFGKEICSIVLEVTDDKSLPKHVRKRLQVEHASSLSYKAALIKLADKISNITDIVESPPEGWSQEQKRGYIAWGGEVVNEIRGTNEWLERYFDELCEKARGISETNNT